MPTNPVVEGDLDDSLIHDEAYFDGSRRKQRSFGAELLKEPLSVVPTRPPIAVRAETSVKASMQAMQQHHRGCILITRDGTLRSPLVGIFTERDVMNRVVALERPPSTVAVGEVMTAPVAVCSPETTREECRAVMRHKRIRHLPVVAGDRLVGIISVGDLLADAEAEQQQTILYLHEYLYGHH